MTKLCCTISLRIIMFNLAAGPCLLSITSNESRAATGRHFILSDYLLVRKLFRIILRANEDSLPYDHIEFVTGSEIVPEKQGFPEKLKMPVAAYKTCTKIFSARKISSHVLIFVMLTKF